MYCGFNCFPGLFSAPSFLGNEPMGNFPSSKVRRCMLRLSVTARTMSFLCSLWLEHQLSAPSDHWFPTSFFIPLLFSEILGNPRFSCVIRPTSSFPAWTVPGTFPPCTGSDQSFILEESPLGVFIVLRFFADDQGQCSSPPLVTSVEASPSFLMGSQIPPLIQYEGTPSR